MNIGIILASGKSERMNGNTHKLMLPIHGMPLIYYTIASFYDHSDVDKLIITVNKKLKPEVEKLVKKYFNNKKPRIILGGKTRAESAFKAFEYAKKTLKAKQNDLIIFHNGANPHASFDEIRKCIKTAKKKNSCIVANPITSTIKETHKRHVLKTHPRNRFLEAQTPQVFKVKILSKAYNNNKKKLNDSITDEALLAENAGYKVAHIKASENNFKVTTSSDYKKIKAIMGDKPEDYLIGLGQDSHMFSHKKGLTLGGEYLSKEKKLEANSDGDVVLHALATAILQAIGDKSLGVFADPLFQKKKITDSKKYLTKIIRKIKRKKLSINNIGIMIEAAKPKIDPLVSKIKKNISELTNTDLSRIGITATSGEKLTSFGKGKGIQCFTIVSLKKD